MASYDYDSTGRLYTPGVLTSPAGTLTVSTLAVPDQYLHRANVRGLDGYDVNAGAWVSSSFGYDANGTGQIRWATVRERYAHFEFLLMTQVFINATTKQPDLDRINTLIAKYPQFPFAMRGNDPTTTSYWIQKAKTNLDIAAAEYTQVKSFASSLGLPLNLP